MTLSVVTACAGNANNENLDPIDSNLDKEVDTNIENNTTENQPDEPAKTNDDQAAMQEKMDKLDFQEFQLEVDYADDIEYQAEIEKESTGLIEAELEDETNNIKLKGLQAFDEIYPLVEKLDITKDSTEEEVVNQVVTAFDLAEDYTEIEVKIVLNDGTKIKHKLNK